MLESIEQKLNILCLFYNFYRQLACSRTTKQERKGLNKRDYCYRVNLTFKAFHDDVRNLVPAIGELNGDRSNYRFGAFDPEVNDYMVNVSYQDTLYLE